MDRRTLLQGMGALVATPALPAIPAAAPVAAHSTTQYLWAAHYAKVHGGCSPDQIASAFGWAKDVATSAFDQLLTDNVVRSPGAFGVAKAVDPFNFDMGWTKDLFTQKAEAFEVEVKLDTPEVDGEDTEMVDDPESNEDEETET